MQSQLNNIHYSFFFDLKNRDYEINYFKMKQKYGNTFTDQEYLHFEKNVLEFLNPLLINIDTLVIPQTGNDTLLNLAKLTSKNIFILEKNTKETMVTAVLEQPMMRSEKTKLMNMLDSMDTIKMAQLAGNQRKRFVNCLFKKPDTKTIQQLGKIALLDDSIFSGYTFVAANNALENMQQQNIILFSKMD